MAIQWRNGEGSRTATTRTINNITGGLLTPNTGDLTTVRVGDLIEIFGSSTAANNGRYTVTAITVNAGADQYQLRPAPTNQGASGSCNRLNRANFYTLAATAITSITALPGAGNLAVIEVTGCDFITKDVRKGDRVPVTGAAAANNGAWYVHEVLSEDKIVVRPPDGGAGMATAGAAGNITDGTDSIRRGCMRIDIVNEAALDWDFIVANATPYAAPGGLAFGSGDIRDYVEIKIIAGGDATPGLRKAVLLHGITRVTFDQASLGSDSVWTSKDEYVLDMRNLAPGIIAGVGDLSPLQFTPITTGWGGFVQHLILGEQLLDGVDPDPFGVAHGSAWVGIRWDAASGNAWDSGPRGRVSVFGSVWDPITALTAAGFNGRVLWLHSGGDAIASIARDGCAAKNGDVQFLITYGDPGISSGDGFYVLQAGGTQQNILISSANIQAAITAAVTIEDFLYAPAQCIDPVLSNFTNTLLTFLNPKLDYDLINLADNFGAGATSEKRYTYFPRFVSRDPTGAPSPIQGLYVEVWEINETTSAETLVASGTTNASGQIATTNLRRQFLSSSEVSTLFSHKLILQGAGYRLISDRFQIKSKQLGDIAVDRISPSYEEEFDE